jgi:TetR/AcrR family transcriptional repressor NalC
LFLKSGYNGVTVDDIVKRAGGSKSTVYEVFGGKCGLFIASIEAKCREFNAPLRDIDYEGLDLKGSLENFGRALLTLITQKEYLALHRLVIAESGHCPELGQAWYTYGPNETLALIAGILRSYPAETPLRRASIQHAAVFLCDGLVTDLQNRLLAGVPAETDSKSIDALVHRTVLLFLLGYQLRP